MWYASRQLPLVGNTVPKVRPTANERFESANCDKRGHQYTAAQYGEEVRPKEGHNVWWPVNPRLRRQIQLVVVRVDSPNATAAQEQGSYEYPRGSLPVSAPQLQPYQTADNTETYSATFSGHVP